MRRYRKGSNLRIFIVYAHPSDDSFTRAVRDEFIKGLVNAGHSFEISDLYKMSFNSDISEDEYIRESTYCFDLPIPKDVLEEQEKINRCDVIAFIYPVFWTEAPAKLVGWFDRVWTYGFAYGERKMKKLLKAIVICITGHTIEKLDEYGHLESMKRVMLGDRIFYRAYESKMVVLDGMTKQNDMQRKNNWGRHLLVAYKEGNTI